MVHKKSNNANLERNRSMFFQIGLVLSLSLVLVAFEWPSKPAKDDMGRLFSETYYEVEEIQRTIRDVQPPKPLPLPKLIELNLVPDEVNVNIDISFFNPEAFTETMIPFYEFPDQEVFDDAEIHVSVQEMPLFNGGKPETEFRKYIMQNLDYPDIAAENGIMGRVLVQFIVNAKGKIEDARVIQGAYPSLDNEALRVINSSPLWTPGRQSGKPVKVIFTFPINFVLK